MVKVRNDPLLIWLGGQRRGSSGEDHHTVDTQIFPTDPAWL